MMYVQYLHSVDARFYTERRLLKKGKGGSGGLLDACRQAGRTGRIS